MSLSVAGSLVDSASSKATTAAIDEVGLLRGVRTEIWYIKDELRTMKAFLRAAERRKDRDDLVKVWAEQVEELSSDIKYCLDGFKVNLGHQGCLQLLTTLRDRHQIGVQIRRLKARVEEVSSRIQRYSHLMEPITSNSMNERETYTEDIPNLSASINQLPPHLKPCFLYLCIFPKGFEIQMRRLMDRWIAEGFVTSRIGMDIEEVAKSYFHELLSRGMIQPSRVNIEGSVRSCRVHDVMHDMMVSVCRDENFVYLRGDIVTSTPEENFPHLAHHGQKCPKIDMDWSHVRSFTLFGVCPIEPAPLLCSYLRMLSVLDLQDAQFSITQKDMNNIGLLHCLKYVNVRGHSSICALPGSVGKLYGLQYLDIRNSRITALPTEISKLQSLRSLRCSKETEFDYYDRDDRIGCPKQTLCLPAIFTPLVDPAERAMRIACSSGWSESTGLRVPRGIGKLKELHILEVVDIKRTGRRAIKELGELMQLRKLNVTTTGASEQKCKILCAAIEELPSLSSLYVDGTDNNMVDTLEWMRAISPSPRPLRSLKLWGYLGEMPDWVGSLMHLVEIRLLYSRLKEGKSMEILGALPNLMHLHLSRESYVGEKLVFRTCAFPNLRKLDIWVMNLLREVRFEEHASSRMERIEINYCRLKSGIIGIKHLPRLKEISLGYAGKVGKLGVLQGEVDAHLNHPLLRLASHRSLHDLGNVVEGSNDVEEEATEESSVAEAASAGESSQPQVAVQTTSDKSQDHHLLYTYNSC